MTCDRNTVLCTIVHRAVKDGCSDDEATGDIDISNPKAKLHSHTNTQTK